jgi:hypothetical protein
MVMCKRNRILLLVFVRHINLIEVCHVVYLFKHVRLLVMFHSYDYISLFAPFLDIPVSLGNLFQRIASIYDRFYLSRLNKLFKELLQNNQVLIPPHRNERAQLLAHEQ